MSSGRDRSATKAAGLVSVLEWLIAADVAACDRVALGGLVAGAQRLRGFLDALDVRVAVRAGELTVAGASEPAGEVLGDRGRRSRRDAERATARAEVCAAVPGLEAALAGGKLSGGHVDAIAACVARLDAAGKATLAERAGDVIAAASRRPVETFARECHGLARRLLSAAGTSVQKRTRHDRTVRRWVDRHSAMCKTLIELDAEADARMWTAITATVTHVRREQRPADDRTVDQVHADTVVDLICGSRRVDPRTPELSVLIDLPTLRAGLHPDSTCETSNGEPLDVDTVRRLGCDGDLAAVLLDNGGNCLAVGRSRRLATGAQRQALRAMYRTCGFPGCPTGFDTCRIHHVSWWEHGGVTDLPNLVPLCSVHHHLVHEGGWQLTLTHDRTITLHRPDGTLHFHGNTTNRPTRHTTPTPASIQPSDNLVVEVANDLATALDTILATAAERAPP